MNDRDALSSLLSRVRRRWFALTILQTGGRAAAAAAVPLLTGAGVAWLLAPSGVKLVALVGITTLAALAAAVFVVFRMRRRPDDCQVARFIEERTEAQGVAPALCDALVSAVEIIETPDRHHGSFAALLVANAVKALRDIPPSVVIPSPQLKQAALGAGAGVLLAAVAFGVLLPHARRAGGTAWLAWFPHSIQIAVLTGDARVHAGQPLVIAATLRGRGERFLSVVPSLVVSADGQQRTVPMVASAGGFSYVFDSVDRSFAYRVAAGAATSPSYRITAVFPPRLTRIDLRYEYPSFTGLPPRDEEDGGDVFGPAGTRVRMEMHADKPLANGELALASGRALPLAKTVDGHVTVDFVLTRDDSYRVRLSDADGLRSTSDLEYFIRMMDDRPPNVRIVRPSGDQGITPLEEVPIEARADDDYGVAEMDLVYLVPGRPPKVVPFSQVSGTAVARVGTHLLAAEDLRVQPGDVITYYARARDVARGKRSSETRSDMFFLEVKPFSEEFVSAQSQAMGGGAGGTQIDSLIAAQKEIINATWTLERRAAAGRSTADTKAVGEAQSELKTRVEQLLGGGRRGGRGVFLPQQIGPFPQQSRRPASSDPIAAAVAAMGRAVEQLHGTKTADAIPHEMTALQALLQAQAEIRRRQVMQQAANGSGQGGSNRADRDLSALFDRELQRQQRTNYETQKASTETPQQPENSDALDRIRELARRQEELAKRQRDLADSRLSAEEMKRQLERLTREQQDLRQQTEELERQLQRNQPARGQTGKSSPEANDQNAGGSPGAAEIRRAADQMRNATGEMQRQNAAGAAASSEKAADTLRELEREMRGDSPDARQRTAGELQLEAQQIADGQRRIAEEASRLDKERQSGGRANPDALRRLAAEKDKLADRVDQLQRAARDAERQAPGPAGTPFRDAAQELQSQQIGSRMRGSAKQMKDAAATSGAPNDQTKAAAPPPAIAPLEQQLSRALDSVVDKLAGNGTAETRRLTEQLDRTREMRDRLTRLEQQVRGAESRAGRADGSASQRDGSPSRGNPPGGQPSQGRQQGRGGQGDGGGELQRAREEYGRELQRARESLSRMRGEQRGGQGGTTPEQHEYSLSAPGNEAFKQDYARWETLRKDIDLALEQFEAAVAARLGRKAAAEDRLSGGGSERVPEAYRPAVARYFESIAKVKK